MCFPHVRHHVSFNAKYLEHFSVTLTEMVWNNKMFQKCCLGNILIIRLSHDHMDPIKCCPMFRKYFVYLEWACVCFISRYSWRGRFQLFLALTRARHQTFSGAEQTPSPPKIYGKCHVAAFRLCHGDTKRVRLKADGGLEQVSRSASSATVCPPRESPSPFSTLREFPRFSDDQSKSPGQLQELLWQGLLMFS